MSANRERGFSNPSVDQMFFEGKRNWVKATNIRSPEDVRGFYDYHSKATIRGNVAIIDDGHGHKTALSVQEYTLEGDVEFEDDSNKYEQV
ncbi:hypothetical protein A3F02_04180 [Candidatus Curtissbacteria bacterium RIFCSPHIGHO2_12_FULL_38_9b]|uniref:Uncharacterized protein n=1 Tax=Candidatus Curtissbacteria bacterium RIFCSPHIGHO2_12_FULL_38_9b TaxID=1797720 RepID=A0A1F5GSY8_9BACT|nr:MAG: hypothetical protein A3F02_04180 [Candidatus Curtissbacteria bacterium RIFCSPHIGHO2_12_FULL_38_9b]